MKIYNQLDYTGVKFGSKKATDMGGWGCKLFSVAIIKQMDPVELDKILVAGGAYFGKNGDLLDDSTLAKVLGWEFLGRETNIAKMPTLSPVIKEVDFSATPGKSQHFCVRVVKEDGSRAILDPFGGVERAVNFYERKSGAPNWEGGGFSYRLFKIPETQTQGDPAGVDYTNNAIKIFQATSDFLSVNYGELPNNEETEEIINKLKSGYYQRNENWQN